MGRLKKLIAKNNCIKNWIVLFESDLLKTLRYAHRSQKRFLIYYGIQKNLKMWALQCV